MRPLPLLLLLLAAPVWAAPPGVTVSWTPARVVLGQDSRVTLEVHVPRGSGPVRGAASSGRFSQERVEGGEVRTFEWTPPPVRYPLVAVLSFWVEDSGAKSPPEWAVLRIPLLGKTRLEVSTAARASVVVEVGGTRFGPVQADGRGRARVPVEVPPGVTSASVLATRDTLQTRASIPLDPPQEAPLVAALTPSPLTAGEGGWLLVAGEEGLRPEALEVSARGAVLASDGPSAGGATLRFRVTPAPEATSVSVTVQRKGQKDRAQAEAKVLPSAQTSGAEEPPPSLEPVEPDAWRASVFALAGGAFASGANTGPAGAVGVSLSLPGWRGRFAAEVEAGLRTATLDGSAGSLGGVRSQVLAVPVLASVRALLLQRSAFSLYGRAGGGGVPFRHRLSSDFQEDLEESKLGGMGFLSLQGAYRFGRWSALAEARGAWAPARTDWLDAQLGGVSALLGVRFEP